MAMKIAYVWSFRHNFTYLMTADDGHFETFRYLSRYYDVELFAPADFTGSFVRDHFAVHGRDDFAAVLEFFVERGPFDVVVCYGPFNEAAWPLVLMRAGKAVVCLDYAGGPLCDLNGRAPEGAWQFDHVFTAHETQARWLRELGVSATKARGVPTNRFRPIPGMPKQWGIICPTTFVPGKRPPLIAQVAEQYAPHKPSLFIGNFENPAIVEMTKQGGIPLNKPEVAHRNGIQLGGRAPYAVMPLLYCASEVCITGSQEEGGPWVALEAMACGVPTIVMADCAWGVSEAFAELERDYPGSCKVVPPSPDAIYAAIEELRTVDGTAARRAIVERYSWFGMYDAIDRELKNRVAFKQAGRAA
jgi:glycosyltransferase involved in cell wall biosynthesis